MCEQCTLVSSTVDEVEKSLKNVTASAEELDELSFVFQQSKRNINAWKAHIIRSSNQDQAKSDALDNLDDKTVFLVQDWAMKYLPKKFRESQRDWFAKRGIPWHITVAYKRSSTAGELEMATFVHIFQSCSQESDAVISIMADVLVQLKEMLPVLQNVIYRQDNAGCYHSALTITAAKIVGKTTGVKVKRLDFTDPQGGKGSCDRKAATIKSHMRLYLNTGHDIETAAQMKTAIESSGGVPNVRVTLSCASEQPLSSVKWDGISLVYNVEYQENNIQVWKAYNVGAGKSTPWEKYANCFKDGLPTLTIIDRGSQIEFAKPKVRKSRIHSRVSTTETTSDDECSLDSLSSSEEPDSATCRLFFCPKEGCVKSFQRYSNLQYHLDSGKHKRVVEHETLLDRAINQYAYQLEVESVKLQEVCNPIHPGTEGNCRARDDSTLPPKGWALKITQSKKRFTANQKEYLIKKFNIGQKTGRKADPSSVSRDMRKARDSNGDRIFTVDEFLTAQQISSFFSRQAKSVAAAVSEEDVLEEDLDECSAREDEAFEGIVSAVMKDVDLHHPIVYDTYNICELVSTGKLSKTLSVSVLQDICTDFDLDVESVRGKRKLKKPYADKLLELVKSCSCSGNVAEK